MDTYTAVLLTKSCIHTCNSTMKIFSMANQPCAPCKGTTYVRIWDIFGFFVLSFEFDQSEHKNKHSNDRNIMKSRSRLIETSSFFFFWRRHTETMLYSKCSLRIGQPRTTSENMIFSKQRACTHTRTTKSIQGFLSTIKCYFLYFFSPVMSSWSSPSSIGRTDGWLVGFLLDFWSRVQLYHSRYNIKCRVWLNRVRNSICKTQVGFFSFFFFSRKDWASLRALKRKNLAEKKKDNFFLFSLWKWYGRLYRLYNVMFINWSNGGNSELFWLMPFFLVTDGPPS